MFADQLTAHEAVVRTWEKVVQQPSEIVFQLQENMKMEGKRELLYKSSWHFQ
jgi:hypothetical protein